MWVAWQPRDGYLPPVPNNFPTPAKDSAVRQLNKNGGQGGSNCSSFKGHLGVINGLLV